MSWILWIEYKKCNKNNEFEVHSFDKRIKTKKSKKNLLDRVIIPKLKRKKIPLSKVKQAVITTIGGKHIYSIREARNLPVEA